MQKYKNGGNLKKAKNIPDIISVNIKLIMVEYLIVVSKFFAFFAP